MKQLAIRIPDELHRRVKVKAAEVGRSMNAIVREMLEGWVVDGAPFEGLTDAELLRMLKEVEGAEVLEPRDECFCRDVRQELKRRWMEQWGNGREGG